MPGYLAPGGRMLPRQALRKRFVGTWKPTMISGCQAWYDASDQSSITASSGAVSQWNDKSGNARHLTQSTGSKQPSYGSGGTNRTQNGRYVVDFDGGDLLSSAAITVAQPVTAFVVCLLDSSSLVQRQILGDGITSPTIYTDNVGGALKWSYYATSVQNSATTAATATAVQLCGVFNGASSALYLNGSSISTANPGSSGWSSKVITLGAQSGSASYWDGWIAECVIYNSALSSTNRGLVEAYLRGKWALP